LIGLSELETKLARDQQDSSSQSSATLKIFITVLAAAITLSLVINIGIAKRITSPVDKVLEGLTNSSRQVAFASAEVSSASQCLTDRASRQAAGHQETSPSIEERASMSKQNADNANQANVLRGETGA
jgi:methyl-accepting chemotaxis protein